MNTRYQEIIDVICLAISQRRLIKFYYESVSSNKKDWRVVEPYIVGIKDGGRGNIFLAGLPKAELTKRMDDRITGHYLIERIDISKLEVLEETFNEPNVNRDRIVHTPTIKVLCRFQYKDEVGSI